MSHPASINRVGGQVPGNVGSDRAALIWQWSSAEIDSSRRIWVRRFSISADRSTDSRKMSMRTKSRNVQTSSSPSAGGVSIACPRRKDRRIDSKTGKRPDLSSSCTSLSPKKPRSPGNVRMHRWYPEPIVAPAPRIITLAASVSLYICVLLRSATLVAHCRTTMIIRNYLWNGRGSPRRTGRAGAPDLRQRSWRDDHVGVVYLGYEFLSPDRRAEGMGLRPDGVLLCFQCRRA